MEKKILIVDDEEVAVSYMEKLTSQIGDTYIATTAQAALSMTYDIHPDIILLDLGLPDFDGFSVINTLKSNEKYFHIPIIVITSSTDRESHLRAIRGGADDFLTKPFDNKLLETRINALFERQDRLVMPTIDARSTDLESKFANVLGMLSEAVIVSDNTDKIELVNQYCLNLFGYTRQELIGSDVNELIPSGDSYKLQHNNLLEGYDKLIGNPNQFNASTKLGKNLSVEINSSEYSDAEGKHLLWVVRDLTEKHAIQATLLKRAMFDSLTGLNTLTAFHLDFDMLASTERTQGLIFALMVDLDDFHNLNIIYGHQWCDNLLIQMASGIGRLCKINRLRAYRLMGDRFLLCNFVEDGQNSFQKNELIEHAIIDMISLIGQDLNIKLSITATSLICTIDELKHKPLLQLLEMSLMTAKAGVDRGRFVTADDSQYSHRIDLASISQLLLSDPNYFDLSVVLQPKVNMSGNITSFEILLRCDCGDYPNISLQEFIEIAENTGAIIKIGYFVIRQACLFLSQLPVNKRFPVSVNLSLRQLSDICFANIAVEICTSYNVPNNLIRFELTESMIADDISLIAERLEILTAANFSVSIDDFGTGQSNLRYIHRLPMAELKIDKSFVDDIVDEDGNYPLIDSICAMARAMGLTIVAEGVETYAQVQYLSRIGCDEIQGYYFYRPMTLNTCLNLINQQELVD
jgi:PAS domain S-box-containing protein